MNLSFSIRLPGKLPQFCKKSLHQFLRQTVSKHFHSQLLLTRCVAEILHTDFEFFLAIALQDLTKSRWPEVVDHYQRFIAASGESLRQAFAWNNTSSAYQKMGECAKAKEAAEKALAISKFGMAEQNRRRSEFCLEMQKLGVTTPQAVASAAPGSPAGASR